MRCTVEVLLGACFLSGAVLALAAGEGTRLKVAALLLLSAVRIDAYFGGGLEFGRHHGPRLHARAAPGVLVLPSDAQQRCGSCGI